MHGQRALVTGGAGFIGSNLANHLAGTNEVIAIDDCSLGTPENLDSGVEFHEASVLDEGLPTDVDVVFHFAALSSYGMHETDPVHGARINIEGFVNVIEQARRSGCETVVYASTSSVYGSRTEPAPESMDVRANTSYEASKLARERYAESFSNQYGMAIAGMRLFSVYQGYYGNEAHKDGYANVIAQFADDIAGGSSPVVYGDGSQTRDFIHIEDVVHGLELVAEHELSGVYNLGTRKSHDFNTVIDRINEELGTAIEPEYVENPIPKSAYIHDTCSESAKIRKETGWRQRIGFQEGVRRVCRPYCPERY
jgi:UDP-glucose 4-epimerase